MILLKVFVVHRIQSTQKSKSLHKYLKSKILFCFTASQTFGPRNNNPLCGKLAHNMALIKLVWKTFTVCRKSAETAKVFSHVPFIIYGIDIDREFYDYRNILEILKYSFNKNTLN